MSNIAKTITLPTDVSVVGKGWYGADRISIDRDDNNTIRLHSSITAIFFKAVDCLFSWIFSRFDYSLYNSKIIEAKDSKGNTFYINKNSYTDKILEYSDGFGNMKFYNKKDYDQDSRGRLIGKVSRCPIQSHWMQPKGFNFDMTSNAVSDNKKFELSLTNFLPGGTWTPCEEKGKFIDSGRVMWTRNSLSGAVYLNQPTDHLRFKLSFLTGFLAGIVGGNAISLTINAAYRALKVVSLSHFWLPISCVDQNQSGESYHFKTRCVEFAKDIARIVATPFAWLALLFASWGGALNPMKNGPRDGAKIFSSIEIAMYGGTIKEGHFGWAPCYQPNAVTHGLGGDINRERAC